MQLLNQPVLPPAQAAKRIGVSTMTISTWMKNGTLKAYKVGGRYFIPESSLSELIRDARKAV